jgi:hypothetical protein
MEISRTRSCGVYNALLPPQVRNVIVDFQAQFVQRGKYSTFVVKGSNLLLYWAKVAVCSKVHTKYRNVLCGESF